MRRRFGRSGVRGNQQTALRKNWAIRLTLTVVLGMVMLAAGCRGDSAEHYDLRASMDCFVQNGDRVHRETDSDFKASGGWLVVDYSDYGFSIAFAADDSEAKRLLEKLTEDVLDLALGPDDVVRRGNAVYFPNNSRTIESDTREKIEACLK